MITISRLRVMVATALLIGSAVVPIATSSGVVADSGEGATPALQDQQRRITVGALHTCAILDTGAAQCWGSNDQGQLGNGSLSTSTEPITVTGLSTVVSIAAGSSHTCALLFGGSVSCWGLNGSGQIGLDPTASLRSTTPVAVPNLTDATAIAAGAFHNCAIVADGTVKCWGVNGNGELGNGTTGFRFEPVVVSGITPANKAVALALGDFHSCAILADTTVRCWGHNGLGQLGDDTVVTSLTPVAVTGITASNGATAIAAGSQHTCVVLADTKVRCWGHNYYGQLGNNDHGNTNEGGPAEFPKFAKTPVTPSGDPAAVAITAGSYHTCILRADGGARCWGNNQRGQLAYLDVLEGSTPVDQDEPREVLNFGGGTALSAGGFHTCAIVGSSVQCWGYNFFGQLGGYRNNSPVPVAVTALSGAIAISTGDGHACAIVTAAEAKAQCWGSNSDAQLGVTGIDDSTVPVVVSTLGQTASLSAGNQYTCLIEQASSQPKCFGSNDNGQLGTGTNTETSSPTPVTGLTNAVQVAAGGARAGSEERGHTCAVRSGGTVACWGRNFNGQLGNDTTTDSNVPVVVAGLSGATAVATGGFHSCAIVAAGAVSCWGANGNGQLGNDDDPDPDGNDLDDSDVPVLVVGVSGATSLSLGAAHSCAVVGGGAVKCWGDNSSGQLGDGSTSDRQSPVAVENIPYLFELAPQPAIAVTAGDFHTCARHANGLVTCWGENADGQLGNGGTSDSNTPIPIAVLTPPPSPNITVLEISAGRRNTCARLIETTVHCWGDNSSGQLGDGIGPFSLLPITVVNLGATVATNAIPNPVNDTITTAPLTAVSVNLLLNDTDADVGDVLTVSVITDPPQGAAVLTPPGTVQYTPDAAVCAPANPDYGRDSFNYTVTDGTASVGASVSVTVTCPNRPPVAGDDSANVAEDTLLAIDVRANDTDPDDDPITLQTVSDPPNGSAVIVSGEVSYTPDADFCGPDSFTYTISDGAASDEGAVTIAVTCDADPPVAEPDMATTTEDMPVTLDVLSNDSDADPATVLALVSVGDGAHGYTTRLSGGSVRYQPDLGYCGMDTFEYVVSDGGIVDTGEVTITISCEPDAPNATDDSAVVEEDAPFVDIDVLANDTDPDGDTLVIDLITDAPDHGTAMIVAGKIRYSPAPNFCGADGFSYRVREVSAQSLTDEAVVAPVNVICNQDAPTANDDVASGVEDTPFAIAAVANDLDVDGDLFSITAVTDPAKGTAVVGANGSITYTPDANLCGADSFVYTIDDNKGGTDTATISVSITCANDQPTLAAVANQTTTWGTLLGLTLVGTDVDLGDALMYSLVSGPAGMTVGLGGGLSWTPTSAQIGNHNVTVKVTDGALSATRSFTVAVTKRPTSLSYTGTSTGAYSDQAAMSAVLVDAGSNTPIAGATVALRIGTQSTNAPTTGMGQANAAVDVSTPAGVTTSAATFAGSAIYLPSSDSQSFLVTKESITTTLSGSYVSVTTSSTASVTLSARVTEQADGRLGSALNSVNVAFSIVGGAATLCTAPVSVTGGGTGTASCTVPNLTVGAHAIMATPTGVSYGGPVGLGAVAVAKSIAGNAVGAGTANGDAFAFEAAKAVRKTPVRGSAVHVWFDGSGFGYVATSTAVSSFATSCSGGGSNRVCPVTVGAGTGSITKITLATGGVTQQGGATISVAATDASVNAPPDRYSVSVTGVAPRSLGTPATQVALLAGAVRVL